MKRKLRSEPSNASDASAGNVSASAMEEHINHDDLCPICHLLLYKPVRTRCNHSMCESCMSQWADISVASQIATVGLDDEAIVFLPHEVETRCPMCRTVTNSVLDPAREGSLQGLYPSSYRTREAESKLDEADDFGSTIETLTVYIGNEHTEIRASEGSNNKHQWKFFVRPSRNDLIEEIQVFLHPTFRNPIIVLDRPPYAITRLGWGYFTIYANVILKAGYSWVSSDAEDTRDGAPKGKLPIEWALDLNGRGSQGRLRLKVKKEKEGQEMEDEAQREQVQRLWARQRETDPDYTEPDDG